MIRHMFISPVKEGVSEEQIDQFIRDMRLLPDMIPQIIQLSVGKNLGLFKGQFAVASVADFQNEEDWKVYMEHPDHLVLAKAAQELLEIENTGIAQIEE